jgi:hypothetical protein
MSIKESIAKLRRPEKSMILSQVGKISYKVEFAGYHSLQLPLSLQ